LPSTITMAANFAKALAAHVADGREKADQEVYEARLTTCSVCDQRTDNRCAACGCHLDQKAAWRSSECPLGKWPV
jgi:cytochrome c553